MGVLLVHVRLARVWQEASTQRLRCMSVVQRPLRHTATSHASSAAPPEHVHDTATLQHAGGSSTCKPHVTRKKDTQGQTVGTHNMCHTSSGADASWLEPAEVVT